MKYILALLFAIPFTCFAQKKCTTAYIHVWSVVDSLPIPPQVQDRVDSAQKATSLTLIQKKKVYKKKYKDAKTVAGKLKEDQIADSAANLKLKRTWLQKFYFEQVREATLKIYDKGKIYNSVMNADSPYFSNLPVDSCDETANCLKFVRERLK